MVERKRVKASRLPAKSSETQRSNDFELLPSPGSHGDSPLKVNFVLLVLFIHNVLDSPILPSRVRLLLALILDSVNYLLQSPPCPLRIHEVR